MARLRELFDAVDVEHWADYEGLDYQLTRGVSGMQLNLKECPYCGDRRWRVYLGAETKMGNCFVCGESFSFGSFVCEATGLSFGKVTPYLSEVLRAQGWRPRREHTANVEHGEVRLPLSFPLPTPDGQNLIYLEKRKVSADLARYFHFRCCVEGWWNFVNEEGNPSGQRFDNRLIIPVYDLNGELKTFQGRDLTGTAERKYLFPKMLPGTGRYLYNGQNARKAKRAVVGEGALDVVAIKRAFDEDVDLRDVAPIGTFGKHLSFGSPEGDDQLHRLIELRNDGLEQVTFMWDGEEKALCAALDGCKQIRRIGIQARIALLPRDKDPDEVPEAVVRQAFYQAHDYSTSLDVKWRLKNPYR